MRNIIILICCFVLYSCGVPNVSNNWTFANKGLPEIIRTIEVTDVELVELGNNADIAKEPSGLAYQLVDGKEYMWLVDDETSELRRLSFEQADNHWIVDSTWTLTSHFFESRLDSEGVTLAEWSSPVVYISSENLQTKKSRLAITAFDTTKAKTVNEWIVTNDEDNEESVDSKVGYNKGIEGITWVPDSDLVQMGFVDDRCRRKEGCDAYKPSEFGQHGGGLFVIAIEGEPDKGIQPEIYIFALLIGGEFRQVAKIKTSLPRVVGLEYDRASRDLWVHCDNECDNISHVYRIGEDRSFQLVAEYKLPYTQWKKNYEGIAIRYQPTCEKRAKAIFLANDLGRRDGGLVRGLVPCNAVVQQQPVHRQP